MVFSLKMLDQERTWKGYYDKFKTWYSTNKLILQSTTAGVNKHRNKKSQSCCYSSHKS
jgi:ribosomal protein S17E